jgi:hypothetical protein
MDKLITLFVGDLACDIGLAYYYLEVLYIWKLLLTEIEQPNIWIGWSDRAWINILKSLEQ